MRVLFWSGTFWPVVGGVEVLATKLLPALQERGYEFVVVTTSRPELPQEAKFKGIPVYRFPFWQGYNNIDQLMRIRQQITQLKRAFAPDLVHRNAVGIGDFFYFITANAHPAPLLVTLHNDLQHQSVERDTSLSRILRSADWVNSVSAAALTQARQLVPEITPRSSVIHNGLDVQSYTPTPLPTDAPRLLCLGRLATQKGFDLALTAFASIVERWPHARLVLAGDGHARPALEQQTAQLGLTHAVDFLGWVVPEKVPALINTATVIVMPSRWEGFPTVALQAAFLARPVVATRVGGLPEIVEHQRTGLLVEEEDSTALAKAIMFLLEHPTTAAHMCQAAQRRAQERFGWERYVHAYDALYRHLIRNWRHSSTLPKWPQPAPLAGA
jgi:glycogen synthase